VHLLEKRQGRVWEVYVEEGEALGKLSNPELRLHARRLAELPEARATR